jgi:hypothetical protein
MNDRTMTDAPIQQSNRAMCRDGSGSIGSAAPPSRPTPVSSGIEAIAERAQVLDKLVGALESRLACVLAAPSPSNDNKQDPRRAATCDLDDRLTAIDAHLDSIATAIEAITARVRL